MKVRAERSENLRELQDCAPSRADLCDLFQPTAQAASGLIRSELMPRLLGVDIPNDKPTFVSLQYLYGVGPKTSRDLCHKAGVDPQRKARELADDELSRLAALLERDYAVEGPLRRQLQQNINRLRDIKCYRGIRHRLGLPVRGQRTRTNARTRKGPKKTVAGKKGVKDLH